MKAIAVFSPNNELKAGGSGDAPSNPHGNPTPSFFTFSSSMTPYDHLKIGSFNPGSFNPAFPVPPHTCIGLMTTYWKKKIDLNTISLLVDMETRLASSLTFPFETEQPLAPLYVRRCYDELYNFLCTTVECVTPRIISGVLVTGSPGIGVYLSLMSFSLGFNFSNREIILSFICVDTTLG